MSYNRKTGMYEGYIYCITNRVNGKQYIGQTLRTVQNRFNEHKKIYMKNPYNLYLYTAMKKYGINNFDVSEITKIISDTKIGLKQSVNKSEIYYIDKLNTLKPNGYNMVPGGDCAGNTFPEKPVIEYSLTGDVINCYDSIAEASRCTGIGSGDISACCNGIKVHRNKNSVFRFVGDSFDPKSVTSVKKYAKYDFDGNLVGVFDNLMDASISVGVQRASISYAVNNPIINGASRTAGGYMWRKYINGYDVAKKITPYKSNIKTKIIQKDKNGNVLYVYGSMKEAEIKTGVERTGIRYCCQGKWKLCNGYIWEYEIGNAV